MSRDISLELKCISVMIKIYCNGNHNTKNKICDECENLKIYSEYRTLKCKYKNDKPVCSSCLTHCYNQQNREKIRTVMRYSGPKMLYKNPRLTIIYLFRKYKS